jgi:[ribosomal protein S18]-alanine N-acetyltransferase
MEFTFRPLSWSDVESITTWHYDAPYTQYDGERFAFGMFVRRGWLYTRLGYECYAVDNAYGDLIGLFTFHKLPRHTVNIGLGLRPELTGLGYGLAFVQAGIAFGKARYAPVSFQLTVDPFNARAIKVYMRAGFNLVKVKQTPQGARWEMRRDA